MLIDKAEYRERFLEAIRAYERERLKNRVSKNAQIAAQSPNGGDTLFDTNARPNAHTRQTGTQKQAVKG